MTTTTTKQAASYSNTIRAIARSLALGFVRARSMSERADWRFDLEMHVLDYIHDAFVAHAIVAVGSEDWRDSMAGDIIQQATRVMTRDVVLMMRAAGINDLAPTFSEAVIAVELLSHELSV